MIRPARQRRIFGGILACMLLACGPCANAEDRGVLKLWCKGTAVDNSDPRGRDQANRSSAKQGRATIDFDERQISFLHWRQIKISSVTVGRIQADRNAFETGNGYHIRIDRLTGEVSFQTLIHDASSGETWYSHGFSGTCSKTDRHGRPSKAMPEGGF